jgi:hypothetical protein
VTRSRRDRRRRVSHSNQPPVTRKQPARRQVGVQPPDGAQVQVAVQVAQPLLQRRSTRRGDQASAHAAGGGVDVDRAAFRREGVGGFGGARLGQVGRGRPVGCGRRADVDDMTVRYRRRGGPHLVAEADPRRPAVRHGQLPVIDQRVEVRAERVGDAGQAQHRQERATSSPAKKCSRHTSGRTVRRGLPLPAAAGFVPAASVAGRRGSGGATAGAAVRAAQPGTGSAGTAHRSSSTDGAGAAADAVVAVVVGDGRAGSRPPAAVLPRGVHGNFAEPAGD